MSEIVTVPFPEMGEGIVEGEVIAWLKAEGDFIAQDESVVTVMTDKASVELPSPHAGVLSKQHVPLGQVATQGQPLYDITLHKKVLASPATRHLARQLNIDLSQVPASGTKGQITKKDIQHLSSTQDDYQPLVGVPHMMEQKMSESHRMICNFSYCELVDASRLIQLKHRIQQECQEQEVHLTFMPFFIKALSLTLKKHPKINSSLDRQTLIIHHQHHIGIAFATKEGLIVPVLKNVERLSLQEIIESYDALTKRVLNHQLHVSEMRGATITLSNFGTLSSSGLWATPVIHYPEAAILALAKIRKQPVVVNDQIVIREMLPISWTFDHRIIDGALAACVSHTFSEIITNPAVLLSPTS